MKRKLFSSLLMLLAVNFVKAQIILFPVSIAIGAATMPEHGFLPGKKLAYYPTINKYDFSGLKLRVELYDNRGNVNLKKVNCSNVEFTNTSEFASPQSIYMVKTYVDTLFKQSNIVIDSTSTDTLQISLEGIDARLIGFGSIRAHGLCQMKMKYRNTEKMYCIDITDADKHSPVSKHAFITRLTATRIIASASVREVVEQFLVDLQNTTVH
jgi:hypothetical protein